MNLERQAKPSSLIILSVVFPNHPAQAARDRRTWAWTGDVWKLSSCLRQNRPDLLLVPVDAHPAGLLFVAGLDPGNSELQEQYNQVVRGFAWGPPDVPESVLQRREAFHPDDPGLLALFALLRECRGSGENTTAVRAKLRNWLESTAYFRTR